MKNIKYVGLQKLNTTKYKKSIKLPQNCSFKFINYYSNTLLLHYRSILLTELQLNNVFFI